MTDYVLIMQKKKLMSEQQMFQAITALLFLFFIGNNPVPPSLNPQVIYIKRTQTIQENNSDYIGHSAILYATAKVYLCRYDMTSVNRVGLLFSVRSCH